MNMSGINGIRRCEICWMRREILASEPHGEHEERDISVRWSVEGEDSIGC